MSSSPPLSAPLHDPGREAKMDAEAAPPEEIGNGEEEDAAVVNDETVPAIEVDDDDRSSADDETFASPTRHNRKSKLEKKGPTAFEAYVTNLIRSKTQMDLEVAEVGDEVQSEVTNEEEDLLADGKDIQNTFRLTEGILKKRSHGVSKRWQQRWFYLIKDKLIYFKRGRAKPAGIIPLNSCEFCEDTGNDEKPGQFSMKVDGANVFHFDSHHKKKMEDFEAIEDKNRWIRAINNNISLLKKEKENKEEKGSSEAIYQRAASCCVARPEKSWKVHLSKQLPFSELKQIHWKQYNRSARTGDILLFSTKGKGPSIIRFGTGSVYDHVALVIKSHGKPAAIIEALGEGVVSANIADFHDYDWWKQYKCVAVRRLKAKLHPNQIKEFESFVKMVIGRKYGLWKPTALFRKKSSLAAENPDRAFFCSG